MTVQNSGQENLQDYAVAVALDRTNFDFGVPPRDGSDLAVWDAITHQALSDWLESYDAAAGKGLLWVKLPSIRAQASVSLWLTAGRVPGCSAPGFSGYAVFPFFSDVGDVLNWQATNALTVSNTVVEGPLTITKRSVIESDGTYNNTPAVVQAANGDFVLSYKKGPGHVSSPFVILRRSRDGGATWSPEEVYWDSSKPDPGLARTPLGDLLIAFVKADSSGDLGGAYSRSADNGFTWGPLISYTSQVGVLQDPEMIQAGAALILMGRDATAIPGVPGDRIGYPRQLVAFVSYDAGQTFGYGTVLDTYTGQTIDGGYSWPILPEPQRGWAAGELGRDGAEYCQLAEFGCWSRNRQVYIVYYADSHNLSEPDIKSVTLSVGAPLAVPSGSLHVLSQLAPGLARHTLNLDATRYSVEFRFRSKPTPAGSQFSVVVQGEESGSPVNLVDWELPSTHAADPTADSGIISNGEFVQVLNSFGYGDTYRVRTLVDETLGTQQALLLDEFGAITSMSPAVPLAQGSAHAAVVLMGNNSNLRATDSLVDFVFVRPAALTEPTVAVSSAR